LNLEQHNQEKCSKGLLPVSLFSCGTKDALARPYLLSHVQKAVY